MVAFDSLKDLDDDLEWALSQFNVNEADDEPINVLQIALRLEPSVLDVENDHAILELLNDIMSKYRDDLYPAQVGCCDFYLQ